MFFLFVGLLLAWVALMVIGALVKTLVWLAILGAALFVATITGGAIHAAKRG